MHRNRFIYNLLVCIICLILNVLIALFARVCQSPFFFDTIFTVAATIMAGLIPGLIVAVLFNPLMTFVLCGFFGKEIAYFDFLYALCGMAIVFITWLFSRDKSSFYASHTITVIYLVIIAISSALASSFIASVLDAFLRPLFEKNLGFSPIDGFFSSFENLNLGAFLSFFLPRVPVTFIDRLICTFAGYLICRGVDLISTRKIITVKES